MHAVISIELVRFVDCPLCKKFRRPCKLCFYPRLQISGDIRYELLISGIIFWSKNRWLVLQAISYKQVDYIFISHRPEARWEESMFPGKIKIQYLKISLMQQGIWTLFIKGPKVTEIIKWVIRLIRPITPLALEQFRLYPIGVRKFSRT